MFAPPRRFVAPRCAGASMGQGVEGDAMALCRIRLGSSGGPYQATLESDLRATDVGRVGAALTITVGAFGVFQLACSNADQAELLAAQVREVLR